MRLFSQCCLVGLILGALAFAPTQSRADDAEPVKQKLFEAKKAFDAEAKKFQKAISESLDKREEDARALGNKKMVDLVKAERAAFEKSGEHPSVMPPGLVNQMVIARMNLDVAYAVAIKEYLRLKLDDAAGAAEKEQQEFKFTAAVQYGRRTYLSTLKATEVKSWTTGFEKETTKAKMDGRIVPHSIFLHPESSTYSNASFVLPGKPIAFRATIGIPKHSNNADPTSAITFEVLADGKSLWKSEPVSKVDTFQMCLVNVEKVKSLSIRVHCPGDFGLAHAVWFAPVVVE